MKLIDRYLLRQFFQVFTICFVSLTGLYVVIDAFGHLEEFIEHSEQGGSLIGGLSQYYGYRSIAFFDQTSSVLVLISALFTVTWIQRHREMTALLAAGVSKARVVAPVIVAAGVISLLAAASRELVIPRIRGELSRDAHDMSGKASRTVQHRYDYKTDIQLRGDKLLLAENSILKPSFLMPTGLDTHGKYLAGEKATYFAAQHDRPAGYLIDQVNQSELLNSPSLKLDGSPVVITPPDAKWLKSHEVFVASEVSPDMLEVGNAWRQYSSTGELIDGLASPSLEFGADVRVAIHRRMVQPMVDMTLLFLGLPLVLHRGSSNVFKAIGACMLLAVVFLIAQMACHWMGASYWINPALATWLPLLLFVPLAALLADPLRE